MKRTLLDWVNDELTLRPEHWRLARKDSIDLKYQIIEHKSGITVVLGNVHHPLVIQLGKVINLTDAEELKGLSAILIGPTHDYMPLRMYYGNRQRRKIMKISKHIFGECKKCGQKNRLTQS